MQVVDSRATLRRFDSLEQEAYLSMWRTYDRLRSIEEEFFQRWDLTAQQYNILRLLRASQPEPVPTLSLVSRLVSRSPDVTRMLDKLAQRELIYRQRSEIDRRAVLVGITDIGRSLLDEIADPLTDSHFRQLGHMTPADLQKLIELLRLARQPHEPDESPWS